MKIDFEKSGDGLVPAIVQDVATQKVLMLGYMNRKAFEQTRSSGRVTFFSRSRGTLWTKGETSGNFLNVKEILLDCDADTILIKVEPVGPVCHTGTDTCFNETNENEDFLFELEKVIGDRKTDPTEQSYTSRLFGRGLNKIAQKFGEEAVELIIEAKDDDLDLFKAEAADVLYHFLVLLRAKDVEFRAVLQTLKDRRSEKEE
ncbi:MAG TPA: bifunctional phosphoribosyl-AMP cyclohydrolase/phosphoribosyl-ATP diphosphatase HisIE [Pyrinomonadaceae bacterium]|jgi:phosphoribosyl-ATP pyrophosphohydrolase/phosphoribosyl-AMP cyclohydrolase|nr:bifunctional phosphoribosyl-AMP cyclohydrolase/phosphoribosyl-ATP diphosphatase HisIE [Pyrinomonadaceae bacterium]